MKDKHFWYRIWMTSAMLFSTSLALLFQGFLIWRYGAVVFHEPVLWLLGGEILLLAVIMALSIWNLISIARLRDDRDN